MIKDEKDTLYGDKHPAWDYPGGEYSSADAARFLKMLRKIGYTEKDNNTISFEMRRFIGSSAEESVARFVKIYNKAMGETL